MARIRGISITVGLVALVISFVALFATPAVTEDFWTDDPYDWDWCSSCLGASRGWSCQWICGGGNQGDYYCEEYSYFLIQPSCWIDCQAPCGDK